MARLSAVWLALAWLTCHGLVWAHAVGLSRGDYQRTREGLRAELVFARADVLFALPTLDTDRDGDLTAAELSTNGVAVERFARRALSAMSEGRACTLTSTATELTSADGLLLRAAFLCPRSDAPVNLELAFLRAMPAGHRHRAKTLNGESLHLATEAHLGLAATGSGQRSFVGYLRLGIEHILSGADHIAFVLALLLGIARMKTLLKVISAFTLAHSLSLAVVALGVWAPSPRWVEPAIALSIVYVALENLRGHATRHPAAVSFGFGLVHGMGFASALSELALTPREIPRALLCFNMGVELGQLTLLMFALPLLSWARRHAWYQQRGRLGGSLALAGCGFFWLLSRLS